MREEFYDIYREMDAEYSRQQLRFGPRFPLRDVSLAVVDEALSEALNESPVRVRPDAVHFLRVNLHQMVAEPLFRREERLGAGEIRLHPRELKEDLKHDAQTVLLEAARISDGGAVTGHQLVNALSRAWDSLRTTVFDIWG
jgi:hypothetical protein